MFSGLCGHPGQLFILLTQMSMLQAFLTTVPVCMAYFWSYTVAAQIASSLGIICSVLIAHLGRCCLGHSPISRLFQDPLVTCFPSRPATLGSYTTTLLIKLLSVFTLCQRQLFPANLSTNAQFTSRNTLLRYSTICYPGGWGCTYFKSSSVFCFSNFLRLVSFSNFRRQVFLNFQRRGKILNIRFLMIVFFIALPLDTFYRSRYSFAAIHVTFVTFFQGFQSYLSCI